MLKALLGKALLGKALLGLGIGVIALSATALTMGSASANSLVSSSPAAGETIVASPSALTITVASPVLDLGNSVTVTDPQGARVDDGTMTVNGTDVIAGLKLLTVSGPYTVTYTLLTDNDVPLQGTYTFTFNAPSVISPASPSPMPSPSSTQKIVNSGAGVPVMVVGLLIAAALVFLGLCLYAWNIFKKK